MGRRRPRRPIFRAVGLSSPNLGRGGPIRSARWDGAPAPHPSLPPGAIHVWLADLRLLDQRLTALLSAEERARRERFLDESSGRLWAGAHGLLRRLLADYLGADPRALAFVSGPGGKPALAAGPAFNISHSGHLAIFAFAADGAVGVDVELDRRPLDEVALAASALGERESRRLAALAPETRRREFLRAWVRHEALLKCRGVGLREAGAGETGPAPWLSDLPMRGGGAAAVAASSAPRELRLWGAHPADTLL